MKIVTVDAFTNKPFTGNPAGVCVLEQPVSESTMLKIAAEINYSETAFVISKEIPGSFHLRWFTPTEEVDLCGHATLAIAKVLYEYGYVAKDVTIRFDTKSGILTSKMVGEKIELDFPAKKVKSAPTDSIINEFINGTPSFVGIDGVWCLIELESESAVKKLKPSMELLLKHEQKIFIVTAKSSHSEYDFVSRCFGPAVGINEDPVTGSAHCYLVTYWNDKLQKNPLIGFQASARTGMVECELQKKGRVLLRGESVIMSELKQNWSL